MARRLIDISSPLRNGVAADPPGLGPTIEYFDHRQSLPQLLPFFPGLKAEDLPDGQGWAVERCNCPPTTAHISTRPGISTPR